MVGGIRFGEIGKATTGPVKVTAINDDSTDGCAVAAHKFGGAVDHDVGPQLKGAT